MTAKYIELYLEQGATYSKTAAVNDPLTGANVNIAGYSFESQLRKSYVTANASEYFTCTVNNAANGIVSMTMAAANTANLKAGRYLFDVKYTDTANNVVRLLEGLVFVTPQVTK